MAIAEPIAAQEMLDALSGARVSDVVAVPDTHQRSLITLLMEQDEIRFTQASTEDEAVAIAAGMIVGGARPILQIQHAGLYACVNNLRGVGIDGAFPIVLLVGLLGRDPRKSVRDQHGSMVRYSEPLLEALEIPCHALEQASDLHFVGEAFDEAQIRGGPVVLLVGEATS